MLLLRTIVTMMHTERAALHACAYDAQDVVRVIEAKKSVSSSCGRGKGLFGLQYEVYFRTFYGNILCEKNFETDPKTICKLSGLVL